MGRALEVSVAGAHNLLIIGPPGAGKSMVAKRIPSMFKARTGRVFGNFNIYSVEGSDQFCKQRMVRPVRTPHHTTAMLVAR